MSSLKVSLLILAIVTFIFSACVNPAVDPIPTPTPSPAAVPKLPVLRGTQPVARTITIPATATQAEWEYSLQAPIITGWSDNSISVTVGDSFTSSVLGQTITTTISKSGEDFIYSGLFSDGTGNYKITLHSDSTFDYEQTIVWDYSGTIFLTVATMTNATISGNDFSGSGLTRFAQYAGTYSPLNMTAAYKYDVKTKGTFSGAHATSIYIGVVGASYTFGIPSYGNSALLTALRSLDSGTPTAKNYLVYHIGTAYYRVNGDNWSAGDTELTSQGFDATKSGAEIIAGVMAQYW